MSLLLRKISIFTAAALAAITFAGCASVEGGKYYSENGRITAAPEQGETLPEPPPITLYGEKEQPVTSYPETLPETETEAVTTEPPETEAPKTEPETETEPEIASPEEDIPEQTTGIDDLIEPLAAVSGTAARDYSALDTECRGYGQGVRFDELNRPKGAVEFNNGYSEYNALAIRETEEKTINLTFDQGYENGFTSKILDVLKEKGVKATFFVVGDYVKREPELVQRMIDEGHTVGSHSVHHYSMPGLSVEECESEIMDLHREVLEKFGIQMTLFRPPKGEYSEKSLAVTGDLGYKTVLWSFAYADWDTDDQPDPAAALEKLKARAHPGAIYLLHSVSETNAGILADFIDAMLAEGYTFSTEF